MVLITTTFTAQQVWATPTHSTAQWQDITGITWSTDQINWGNSEVSVDDTIYFKFDMHKSYDGTHYMDLLKAWIDWNKNGQYEENESLFFSSTLHGSYTQNTGAGSIVNKNIPSFYSGGFELTEDNIGSINILVRVTCTESVLSSTSGVSHDWDDQWEHGADWYKSNFGSDGHLYQGEVERRTLTVNPVPEPTTMLLFGTGLVCLASVRRRKTNWFSGKQEFHK